MVNYRVIDVADKTNLHQKIKNHMNVKIMILFKHLQAMGIGKPGKLNRMIMETLIKLSFFNLCFEKIRF